MARRAKVGPHGKRGRPYSPFSRRNQTDRAGRRGEVDRGSPRLRARKLLVTTRDDIEMTGPGILCGHDLLDRHQYDTLGHVTLLLRRIARSFGRDASPAGVWAALLAAASRTPPGAPAVIGDYGARDTLARICRRLDGSRDLVLELAEEGPMPSICARGRASPYPARPGSDRAAAPWSRRDLTAAGRASRVMISACRWGEFCPKYERHCDNTAAAPWDC